METHCSVVFEEFLYGSSKVSIDLICSPAIGSIVYDRESFKALLAEVFIESFFAESAKFCEQRAGSET